MKRCLSGIDNELERVISCYLSFQDAAAPAFAGAVGLVLKHILRGLFYMWSIYLLLAALVFLPISGRRLVFLFVLMPGLLVWLLIYIKGARDDYYQYVRGRILKRILL